MSTSLPKLEVSIQPLGDNVVVVPVKAEQVTASGIIIPDTAKSDKPQQGTVIAMGKGGIINEHGVKVPNPHDYLEIGDTILFGNYSGSDIKLKSKDGKDVEIKILHLDSILGIVK